MEVVLTLLYTVLLSYVVYKSNFFCAEGITAKTSVALFNLKVAAGIALTLIYTYYYTDKSTGDIYKYFMDGERIYKLFWTDPLAYFQIIFGINTSTPQMVEFLETVEHWTKHIESPLYNDNRTIIRFNALAHLISFGSIGVHTVLMCFLSYIGLLSLYKTFHRFFKGKELELIGAIFLLPSVIFWGSGALKEGILLFAFGILIHSAFTLLHQHFSWKRLVIFVFSIFLLAISKIYVLFAVLPSLLAYAWSYLTGEKKNVLKYAITFGICFLTVLAIPWLFPNINVLEMLANKQHDFVNVAIANSAKSYYLIPSLEPNVLSFIIAAPQALLNVLVRPHLLEAGSAMMLVAALENLFILFTIFLCVIFSKKKIGHWNFMFFCIGFIVILFTLIGLTTPVFGAVVRYKIPGLPFLILIFLLLFDKEKFTSKFPLFKFLNR